MYVFLMCTLAYESFLPVWEMLCKDSKKLTIPNLKPDLAVHLLLTFGGLSYAAVPLDAEFQHDQYGTNVGVM